MNELKGMARWLTAFVLVSSLFSCKPPPGTPVPSGDGTTPGAAPQAVVPAAFTDKITFDFEAEQDNNDPGIIHLSAYPTVDATLLQEHPDGRLIVEFQAPYGTSLVAGMLRQRIPLQEANNKKVTVDIRVINRGKMEIKVIGTIIARNGTQLVTGEKGFKIVSGDNASVELNQKKIAEDEAREAQEKEKQEEEEGNKSLEAPK